MLRTLQGPAEVDAIAAHFVGKKTPKRVKEIGELVETLKALGGGVRNITVVMPGLPRYHASTYLRK